MRRRWSRLPGWAQTVIAVFGVLLLCAIVLSFFRAGDTEDEDVPFSTVVKMARDGEIERIEVRGRRLEIDTTASEDVVFSRVDHNVDVVAVLAAAGVTIGGDDGVELEYERLSQWGGFFPLFINFVPPLVVILIFYFTVRNAVREGFRRAREDDRQ